MTEDEIILKAMVLSATALATARHEAMRRVEVHRAMAASKGLDVKEYYRDHIRTDTPNF